MTALSFTLSLLYFIVLGTAYVYGFGLVKKRAPQYLVQFYFLMTAIRFTLSLGIVAVYAFKASSKADLTSFALMFVGMYLAMVIITLILKN